VDIERPAEIPAREVPRSIVLRVRHLAADGTRRYELDDLAADDEGASVLATIVVGAGAGPTEVEILQVQVEPDWQGLGLASRLLDGTIDLLRRDGATCVTARASPDRSGCTFFQRHGFVPAGRPPPASASPGLGAPVGGPVWLTLEL
jgi:GNAT superfamily N-acetyltransferase